MYIIDNTVFIHIQKCYGSSIEYALNNDRKNDLKYSINHLSVKQIPHQFIDYRRIALVRNPIDFYISFYNHLLNMNFKKPSWYSYPFFDGKNRKNISIDDYIKSMLNFDKTFMDSKILQNFIDNRYENKNHTLSSIITDTTLFVPDMTLYQFVVNGLIDNSVQTFKCETEFDDVCKILNIKKYHKNKSNKKKSISLNTKKLILERDEILYDRFGYIKEY
jgi:hypothetical protein